MQEANVNGVKGYPIPSPHTINKGVMNKRNGIQYNKGLQVYHMTIRQMLITVNRS